jgi:hypothetical protein
MVALQRRLLPPVNSGRFFIKGGGVWTSYHQKGIGNGNGNLKKEGELKEGEKEKRR